MTADTSPLALGEGADEADWRALVSAALKGAPWDKLVSRTADGIAINPLYREPDCATARDVSGMPGAAPFIRGTQAQGGWLIRQSFAHADPERVNRDILADLAGGVSSIELVIGADGVAITDTAGLDVALADVVLEAAPVALDAGARGLSAAELLAAKLKGAPGEGVAFNVDPLGALMRDGALGAADITEAARFALRMRDAMPAATALRVDARPVHEAGGTEAQEIAAALSSGIFYLRALTDAGLSIDGAGAALLFTLSVGPDILVECAKLRALRLCWARVMEASGAAPEARAARIHAVTSRRMMTRHDAWTNILRVTCAAFGAGIGGAQAITTLPLTDALGLPTPFARRVARNTQLILLEEAHLGVVADPAGGAWFVETLTRELAAAAWEKMQAIEAAGGVVVALASGSLQKQIGAAREARQKAIAHRRESITGITDFPLLDAREPEFEARTAGASPAHIAMAGGGAGGPLLAMRWAAPFEALRDRAETRAAGASPAGAATAGGSGKHPAVFFANLGPLAEFSTRANFAANLFAAGGVAAIGAESVYDSIEEMAAKFAASGARVAALTGADARYAESAEAAARALKARGCDWLAMAGKPGAAEQGLRAAGVDQFVFAGQDALGELETLHAALGLG
jgi:methylmalonyl-CoA mutase